MPSVHPGYNYDIFISYRQKDNKGDRWVTEFVEALRNELESTFKEEISVYFDVNPHDGLLENHQVDASLKEKLKCLVFIPIISRTYCDPKSFAWQHEFVAFNQSAKADEIGRDIKLKGGNVASRILPVRIHDLDATDLKLLEGELGGPLRPIDFIFKSAGINRPLRPVEENHKENLNRTSFRDQINKVANAVKEIITTIQNEDRSSITPTVPRRSTRNSEPGTRKYVYYIAGSVMLAIAFFMLSPGKSDKAQYDYDVGVMYLENFTDNPKYGDELASLIHINLAQDTGLHLLPRQKLFDGMKEATGEAGPPDKGHSSEIARKTGTRTMLTGSVHGQGGKALVNLELIEVSTGKIMKAEKLEGNIEEIFALADKISAKFSEPNFKGEFNIGGTMTEQYDAYKKFYQGLQDMWGFRFRDAAINFKQATELDSTFAMAYMYRAMVARGGSILNPMIEAETARKLSEKARKYSYKVPPREKKMIEAIYNMFKGDTKLARDLGLEVYNDNRDERTSLLIVSWPMMVLHDKEFPDLLEEYLVRNPSDGLQHNMAGYLLADRRNPGDASGAEEHIKRYITLEPRNPNTYHSGWEITMMTTEDEAKALNYLKQWKVQPREQGSMLSIHNMAMARPDEVIRLYNEFKDSVNTPSFLSTKAFAGILRGQFNNAIRDFNANEEKYRKANDGFNKLIVSLFKGVSLAYMHRYNDSDKVFDKIIRESDAELKGYNPFGLLSCYHAAVADARTGSFDKADRRLRQFDSLATAQHAPWLLLQYRDYIEAEIALAHGRYDETTEKLKLHKAWFGTQVAYLYPSYAVEWKKGNFDKAVGLLIPFQQNILWSRFYNGGNPAIFTMERTFAEYNAGRISEDSGKKEEALKYYKIFLERFKNSDAGIPEKVDAEKRMKELKTKS